MKLAFSNIAWDINEDGRVLEYLSKKGFAGLEIAPTKLFGEDPYSCAEQAVEYSKKILNKYGISICSMQSLWYGQTGNIFASSKERQKLKGYTHRAVDFASAVGCRNMVFGNPKARNKNGSTDDLAVAEFFRDISDYAYQKGTCMSLEPNPTIYKTDFINTTAEAFEYCKMLEDGHLKVNVDLGTVIQNDEDLSLVMANINLVRHIHISEPYLKKIEKRQLHRQLASFDYDGFVSVEMAEPESIDDVFEVADYISEVFLRAN